MTRRKAPKATKGEEEEDDESEEGYESPEDPFPLEARRRPTMKIWTRILTQMRR